MGHCSARLAPVFAARRLYRDDFPRLAAEKAGPMTSRWPHRLAVALSLATVFLIFVGGLVTSTDSGLAVPDWPLSYGQFMPPMIGGIFYEHGHRMVATFIGFLTICLAVLVQRKENRTWVKKAAWGALALVIVQGLLGGMTVLLRLPRPVSIAHACTAQTFLSLITALAIWTSPFWSSGAQRTESPSRIPLHHLGTGLFATLFVQLILGAVVRHIGWGITLHIACGLLAAVLVGWIWIRSLRSPEPHRFLVLTTALVITIAIQISLGFATYFILGHEFSVIPPPFWSTLLITFHVMTGAVLLALSVVYALAVHRTKPDGSPSLSTKVSDYFELTKPGISIMAGMTALAGFIIGARGNVNWFSLFHTGFGTLLVAAGACALNMVIEREVDAQMKRTQKRPLPSGRMRPGEALLAGTFLAGLGIVYLAVFVNALTAVLSALTLSIYIYVYTPLKKHTALCTAAGAVAGSLPPVMGWTAATRTIGPEAWILFGILFFWQFPHFFSLAWLYKDDYSQAGLRMLPVDRAAFGAGEGGMAAISMLANSVALLLISLLPSFFSMAGWFYFVAAAGLGIWITVASYFFLQERTRQKAKSVFFASLAYIPLLFLVLVLNRTAH